MPSIEFIQYTKRALPHIQLSDCVLFVTWHLAFSIKEEVKDKLTKSILINKYDNTNIKKCATNTNLDQFYDYDSVLDAKQDIRINISLPPHSDIVKQALLYYNGNKYELYAFCIMPNHVHAVMKPLLKGIETYYTISEIMHGIKSYTSHKINKLSKTSGKVWQAESFDHVVRDETELREILNYVINNPVKAGFVDKWDEWYGTYINARFMQ
jgi:REP element-mobilizing transposase RayT